VEVAAALAAPLNVCVARKIGHPANPEFAVGAVTARGPLIWSSSERDQLDATWLRRAEMVARMEAARRAHLYGQGRPAAPVTGKVAILIDDGMATGLTMRAAASELQREQPKRLVVAVPCAPRDAVDDLYELADEVVVLSDPDEYLGAVSAYYAAFPQLTDEEVVDLLGAYR
jgi:predicted phosphoribosyltransferase